MKFKYLNFTIIIQTKKHQADRVCDCLVCGCLSNNSYLLLHWQHKLMEIRQDTLFDRIFRDSEGNIVIAQPPNLPLIVGIVASLLKIVFTPGTINLGLELVAFGSLFTWAWQELFEGVNYFRRALGLIGLLGLIAWKLQ
jgi:hypothetical protein